MGVKFECIFVTDISDRILYNPGMKHSKDVKFYNIFGKMKYLEFMQFIEILYKHTC